METNTTVVSVADISNAQDALQEALDEIPTNNETSIEESEVTPLVIPENSASITIDETTSRFSSAIWYEKIQEKIITLAGLGGIGSYVGFLLGRMKPKALFLYDDDVVEASNMSGQLYSSYSIGEYKTTALMSLIHQYSNFGDIFTKREKFTNGSEPSDIMICGFDNMEARQIFYNAWCTHVNQKPEEERKNCLFLDGRLAAESLQVFCLTGDDDYNKKHYVRKWLFDSYEADATVCSYKQTSFCANMIGSIMVNLFVNFCANQCNPLIPRDLPFFTSYDADTMYFKTEN